MTHAEARRWAEVWIEAWNRRDVDAVAAHFPDLQFELDDVHLGVDCISIQYRNQSGRHVTEMAVFGPDGKVTRGWGLYDAG